MTERIDASRKNVRKFGYLFGVVGVLLGVLLFFKENSGWYWAPAGGAVFFLLGIAGYPLLRPVYVGWMAFAFLLAWINTRVLLGLFFALVIVPVGLLMRIFGNDPLARTIDRSAGSYWKPKEKETRGKERYTRLF